MTRDEPQREPVQILRPDKPIAGDQKWVTVRAGVPDRVVPRPVTWLSTPFDDPKPVKLWIWDADWDLREVPDQNAPEWLEYIYTTMGERTALHLVRHHALGTVHIALHGDDVPATAAALVEELGAKVLDGPPDGWERTVP